jgi:hypothetical protein
MMPPPVMIETGHRALILGSWRVSVSGIKTYTFRKKKSIVILGKGQHRQSGAENKLATIVPEPSKNPVRKTCVLRELSLPGIGGLFNREKHCR